jgi:hypothetical protein
LLLLLPLPFAVAFAVAVAVASEIGPGFSPDIANHRKIGL